MIKTITRLEHQMGNKIYHFTCDIDSPVHEIKEALSQFLTLATISGNQANQNKSTSEVPAQPSPAVVVPAIDPPPVTPEAT